MFIYIVELKNINIEHNTKLHLKVIFYFNRARYSLTMMKILEFFLNITPLELLINFSTLL